MPNPNLSFSSQLASTLADRGVEHACVSPGSRNTPLIAGFAAEPRIKMWPILDERSAGFFGIGLARATGRPVALLCTSGTAAVEFHPAVVEASQSDVPLLILTADRPPELRGIGAPQTIDQISLYGSTPRLFIDADVPGNGISGGDLANEAWLTATSPPPGPVHLNLPFREPLLDGSPSEQSAPVPPPAVAAEPPLDLHDLATSISHRRGLIIAGRSNDPAFPLACSQLAEATGFPVIADPLSGLRFGTHPRTRVLAYADALVAAGGLDLLTPDIIIRLGPIPTSKPVWHWLETHPEVEQLLIGAPDATRSATRVLSLSPTDAAVALAAVGPTPAPADWAAAWAKLDNLAGITIAAELHDAGFPNEPAVARTVVASMPPGSTLTLASSMPIRDVDTYGGTADNPVQVFGNRGANGIDGIVSSALGSAAAGSPAVVLAGDISMFHDLNALGTAAQLSLPITIVVVHNDGGGIFHFLPQNDPAVMEPGVFETYLATPHGTDFAAIAASIGIESCDVSDPERLARLVATPSHGPRLVQVRTNRHDNLVLHRQVITALKTALAGAGV